MIKLLIVDDEKIIRQTISEHIDWKELGIEVIGTAKDGIEAYDMILDDSPDIIMTDIKMPGLSGLELLQRIKKINKNAEFIILSGYNEFDFAREAMQYGVRHYLLKPCNEEQIIQSVKQVMEDLAKKRAFGISSDANLSIHQLEDTMILNIINEGVAYDTDDSQLDFSKTYQPYYKFIDFHRESYELCHLYFVDKASLEECKRSIESFKESYAPSISFHMIYVNQTFLFFFKSFHYDYTELDHYMSQLHFYTQTVSCMYKRTTYAHLSELLDNVIQRIKRYETIYYISERKTISICNYRNIIRSVELYTDSLYSEDDEYARSSFTSLLELLSQIVDPNFLKQLIASIIMRSSSKAMFFSSLDAVEYLLEINAMDDCNAIYKKLAAKLYDILGEFHSTPMKHNALSSRIDAYVRNNLSDTRLSLKWISENYLYMNVDYVSKRFFKETGKKFSNYLTDLRIQKSKELLADSDYDRIQSIAEMVGCGNNPQYFSQFFKKATGVTPSSYIKHYRRK